MRDDPRWFELLCCPACQQNLQMGKAEDTAPDGHILRGVVVCQQCNAKYPIVRGVPRFAAPISDAGARETVEGFGQQWKQANEVVQSTGLSGDGVFLDFIEPVKPDHFKDKVVLDGGCGQGRFTILAQKFGAAAVVGADLSESVETAFENTRAMQNVLIAQADLLALPLRQAFDYAFSVGVLHHTSDPRRAFASVASRVKEGGSMSAWVYGRENNGWIIHILNPIRKHITSRLPRPMLWVVAYLLAIPLYVLITAVYLPISRTARLAPLGRRLFYFEYLCWLGKHCGFREQALVVFDHLVPAIAEYIPRREFQEWFEENDLGGAVITSRANNSWRGFGIRAGTPG